MRGLIASSGNLLTLTFRLLISTGTLAAGNRDSLRILVIEEQLALGTRIGETGHGVYIRMTGFKLFVTIDECFVAR